MAKHPDRFPAFSASRMNNVKDRRRNERAVETLTRAESRSSPTSTAGADDPEFAPIFERCITTIADWMQQTRPQKFATIPRERLEKNLGCFGCPMNERGDGADVSPVLRPLAES